MVAGSIDRKHAALVPDLLTAGDLVAPVLDGRLHVFGRKRHTAIERVANVLEASAFVRRLHVEHSERAHLIRAADLAVAAVLPQWCGVRLSWLTSGTSGPASATSSPSSATVTGYAASP